MFDVVIRGGTVFDGRGSAGTVADVAIADGTVVEVGRVTDRARQTIDAAGRFVAPGFIDGHTHLDAQIFWDPYAGSLTEHGVTSAVMGNCGFTLAPGAPEQADLIIASIERAEDMSREAIQRGVPWRWTTFEQYLDAVEALPKALNVAAQCGHSAVRASVMGERAFTDAAADDEIRAMRQVVARAIAAGALGFSTSRSKAHLTKAGGPVASRIASWDEVSAIVSGMGDLGAGIFQLAPERPAEPDQMADYQARLSALAAASRRPVTFMVGGQREQLDAVDARDRGRRLRNRPGARARFRERLRLPYDPAVRPAAAVEIGSRAAARAAAGATSRPGAAAPSRRGGGVGPIRSGRRGRGPCPSCSSRSWSSTRRSQAEPSVAELGRQHGVSPSR